MILIEWLTKPNYLITLLDLLIMVLELGGAFLLVLFVYEWRRK